MATKDSKSEGDSAKTGADRSDPLESLGLLVDGTTKTIATWAAALIVFAYFGFGQREWQLHSGREALTKIRSEATRLKSGFDDQERKLFVQAEISYKSTDEPFSLSAMIGGQYLHDERDSQQRSLYTTLADQAESCARLTDAINADLQLRRPSVGEQPPKTRSLALTHAPSAVPHDPSLDRIDPVEAAKTLRILCNVVARKQARLVELSLAYDRQLKELSEVSLKTPLFETSILTNWAPTAQLLLTLLLVYYVSRRRREALFLYRRAVELADVTRPGEDKVSRVHAFSVAFGRRVGRLPLWLLPFPSFRASSLGPGLSVVDALGQPTNTPRALLGVAVAAAVILAYSTYLFFIATSIDLSAIFGEGQHFRLGPSAIHGYDIAFLLPFFCLFTILFLLLTLVFPLSYSRRSPSERRFVVCAILLLPVALPVAAYVTGRREAALSSLPKVWRRHVHLPGMRPRHRARKARAVMWQLAAPEVLREHPPGSFFAFAAPNADFRGVPVHYVFPARTLGEQARLRMSAKGRLPKPSKRHAVTPDALVRLSAQRTCSELDSIKPSTVHLNLGTASISAEAYALERAEKGDFKPAIAMLEHAISSIESGVRCAGGRSPFRLYDLAAGLSVRSGDLAGLQRLADRLKAKQPAVKTGSRRRTQSLADAARFRARLNIPPESLEPSNKSSKRARAVTSHTETKTGHAYRQHPKVDLTPLTADAAQINLRIAKWEAGNSAWRKKWQQGGISWACSDASKAQPTKVQRYKIA